MGCEQPSQYQRTSVRLLGLSVPGYLNYTLASNNNDVAAASAQGSVNPLGSTNLYPIVDVEGEGNVTINATTQFVADKNVVSAEKILPMQVSSMYLNSSADSLSQDIKTFLSKPQNLMSGVLSTTDTFSTVAPKKIPQEMLTSNLFKRKLEGFLGFRATTVFKIVVNATRFQQGRYILAYIPVGGADINSIFTQTWIGDHLATLVQRTTVPHVEIDLCCDTEATIRIPFNSALNFYPISSITSTVDRGAWGSVFLYPYVALQTGAAGPTTCSYTIFAHFEDVQLVSATIPQSGRYAFSKKGRNETEKEQDSVGIGPISSVLIKVKNVADIFTQVPLLSAYANSVSWFADIGSSAAKVLGWSKPVSLAPSMRVTQNYLPYAANTDGPDMSFPLSLSSENSVGPAPGFSGTDVDEMSLAFLTSIPVWQQTIIWQPSSAVGGILTTYNVDPINLIHNTTVNAQTMNHLSPLQLVAAHFTYWRGSLVYKMKIVKTEFHSGRLSVQFLPSNFTSSVPILDVASSAYLHRHIIDIREANEFTFVVPFISDSPYKTCYYNQSTSYTGTFTVMVVDKLVSPETVSANVSIIFERCAGPDFEVAVPRVVAYNYYTGVTPQSGDPFTSVSLGTNVCSNVDSTIGTSIMNSDGNLNSLYCIGEKILSLRTLMKLPQRVTSYAAVTPNVYLNILPFGINAGSVVTTTNTPPPNLNDLYSRFASCYVYSRGGVRIKFLDNASVTAANVMCVRLDTRDPNVNLNAQIFQWGAVNAGGDGNTTSGNNMPTMYYKVGYSGEVQVPQYAMYHSRVNSDCVSAPNWASYNNDAWGLAPPISISRFSTDLATVDCKILRSLSDDANFGSFLSVPPMPFITSTF